MSDVYIFTVTKPPMYNEMYWSPNATCIAPTITITPVDASIDYGGTLKVPATLEPAKATVLRTQKYPPILAETVTDSRIYCFMNQKKPTLAYHELPTIDSALMSSVSRHFGYLNEVEFSSNFVLEHVIVQGGPCSRSMTRFYFDNSVVLSMVDDCTKIINQKIDGVESKKCRSVLRLDYCSGEIEPKCTIKLKVIKERFNVDNRFTVGLTGAVEMDAPEFQLPLQMDTPRNYTKKRHFIYWFVRFTVRSVIYKFRVAFRCDADTLKTECNIECEDIIDPYLFALIFDLLFKYYKAQYLDRNCYVSPTWSGFKVDDLNDEQNYILKTMELVDERIVPYVPPPTPSLLPVPNTVDPMFGEFVKALGVDAFRRFYKLDYQCIKSQPPHFLIQHLEGVVIKEDFEYADDTTAFGDELLI